MATRLIRENGDIIIIDAMLRLAEDLTSTVTKFPVENRTSISDHIFNNNIKYNLTGIVSDAASNRLEADSLGARRSSDAQVVRDSRRPRISFGNRDFGIPATVLQFLPQPPPPVVANPTVSPFRADSFRTLMKDIFQTREIVSLQEEDAEVIENLVFTTFGLVRDKNTKRATSFMATLEQLRFVEASSVTVPAAKVDEAKAKDAAEQNNSGDINTQEATELSILAGKVSGL